MKKNWNATFIVLVAMLVLTMTSMLKGQSNMSGGGGGVTNPLTSPLLGIAGSSGANTCLAANIAYSFSGSPTSGLTQDGANTPTLCSGGTRVLEVNQTAGGTVFVAGPLSDFANDVLATLTTGTFTISGSSNPIITSDNNSCRVTADISLSTSPVTVCSFPLPAVAHSRAWHCDLLWSVTAGTTPTLTIGVNPSQTPTGATNAWAELKTTNANVATELAVTLSASGNTNILTTPTLTTATTIFSGTSFGTVLAPATIGTLAITMTGTGAGFAGVARAGTTCQMY